jgi:hypothetical protein
MADLNSRGSREELLLRRLSLVALVLLVLAACQNGGSSKSQPTPTTTAGDDGEGNAHVLHVRAVQGDEGTWTFHVTVEHPDTGWEDYADGWDVLTPDGDVLRPDLNTPFTRLLLHPHVNEQPFTRSQTGIEIPSHVTQVRVRAHDLVDGYGGREVVVDLVQSSGPDFEVLREGG